MMAPQGINTHQKPSAKEVAAIIRQIRRQDVRALFVENISDPRQIQQIARETDARVGGVLYSDALAAEGLPSSYIGMMQHNVRSILEMLK